MASTTWRRTLARIAAPVILLALTTAVASPSAAEDTGCYAIAGNLLQNCGFEDGYALPWTITVNGGFTYVTDQDWSGYPANSGTHFVESHSWPGSLVEQTFDTVSGVTYQIGFYLRGGNWYESEFYLNVDADAAGAADAVTLLSQSDLQAAGASFPLAGYTLFTTQFVAQGSQSTLTFLLKLLPMYWWLDDVYVVPLTSPQTITVTTAAPWSATYGESFQVAATASSGLPVAITATGGCAADGSTVKMTSGTIACVVHYNQTGDSAYSPAPEVTNSVTALKANQAVTFDLLADGTAGEPPLTVVATSSSGLPVTFGTTTPSVCTSSGDDGSTITLAAAGTCTVTADQTGDADYEAAAQVRQSFTVRPAKIAQTISVTVAPPASAAVGDSFHVAAVASSGLPVEGSVSGPCGLARHTVTVTGATADCVVTFRQAGDATYSPAPDVTYTVAVNKAAQTITFRTLADRRLSQSPLTLRATATSRLPVVFASLTDTVCRVDGSVLTLLTPGTCSVQATQPGNDSYVAAPPVTRGFTIR